jgi:hypothetical protein
MLSPASAFKNGKTMDHVCNMVLLIAHYLDTAAAQIVRSTI